MLEVIGLFLLKILLGVIVIYFIAAFIVSLKKILPFLSILSSIALIVLLYFIGGKIHDNYEYLLYIVALGVFNQLCFQGEGFMEEHIVENSYRIVSIDRRWNSLFADYDDYNVHLAPQYIGGFIENTVFIGIFYAGYYFLFGGNDIQYVLPLFFLLRSIVDLVYFIYKPSGLIALITNIFCLIFSILLSVYIVPKNDYQIKISYKDCEKYIVLDYSMSYEADYHKYIVTDGYKKDRRTSLYFVYDSYLNAGGYCHSSELINKDNPYQKIVYRDIRFDNDLIQFNMSEEDEYKYDFGEITKEVGDLYKYDTAEGFVEDLDYSSYLKFSKEIYDNMTINLYNKDTITLTYTCEISDDNNYTVHYDLNCNNRYKPTSLKGIRAKIYTSVNMYHEVSYTPIYEEADDKEGVLGNTNLKDRFYQDYDYYEYVPGNEKDAPLFLIGYKYEEPEGGDETYGVNFNEVILDLRGKEDVISNYDFILEETLYGGDPLVYVYDSDFNRVGLYYENSYSNYKLAKENNDFNKYHPNRIIYNELLCSIELDNGYGVGGETTYYSSDEFIKYTADNEPANRVITKAFNSFEFLSEPDYRLVNNEVQVVFSCKNTTIANEYVKYVVYFEDGAKSPYKIEVDSYLGERTYKLTMYYGDIINISI